MDDHMRDSADAGVDGSPDGTERRLRQLLVLAAEPETALAGVRGSDVAERARRRWRRRATASLLVAMATAAAVVAAFTVVRAPVPQPPPVVSGATPAQLAAATWGRLPQAPVPLRSGAASAWTGNQLLVWGGTAVGGSGRVLDDGAAYDPVSRRWQLLSDSVLSARTSAASVWTGKELFVWGGYVPDGLDSVNDGALYDPASGRWRRTAPSPLGARAQATAFWTGAAVVVLGGQSAGTDPRTLVDGAVYDPTGDTWRPLPSPALPPGHDAVVQTFSVAVGPRAYLWTVWTRSMTRTQGDGLLMTTTGGVDLSVLDITTGTWAPSREWPADRGLSAPIWTGTDILFPAVGRVRLPGSTGPMMIGLRGARWDPTIDRWTRITHGPVDDLDAQYVWTGNALLAVNTSTRTGTMNGKNTHNPGEAAVWDPATDTWTSIASAPFSAEDPAIAWSGRQLLLWGPLSGGATGGLELTPRQ